MTNVLTDEVSDLQKNHALTISQVRAVEAATIKALAAGVSVESVGYLSPRARFYKTRMMAVENCEQLAEPLYTEYAIAAARVQAVRDYIESAVSELTGAPYTMPDVAPRALIGKEST